MDIVATGQAIHNSSTYHASFWVCWTAGDGHPKAWHPQALPDWVSRPACRCVCLYSSASHLAPARARSHSPSQTSLLVDRVELRG